MGYTANAKVQDLYAQGPMRRMMRRLTGRVNDRVHGTVKEKTPVAKAPPGVSGTQFAAGRGREPGTLKESWYTTDVDEGTNPSGTTQFSADTLTDDPIGPLVEWPTRPHLIRPSPERKAASVVASGKPRRGGDDPMARLRFVNEHGRVVYAREVHHPGTEGKHMLRDSLAEVDGTWVEQEGAEEIELWAREQAKLIP